MAISQEPEQQAPHGLTILTTYLYTRQKLFHLKHYKGFHNGFYFEEQKYPSGGHYTTRTEKMKNESWIGHFVASALSILVMLKNCHEMNPQLCGIRLAEFHASNHQFMTSKVRMLFVAQGGLLIGQIRKID